MPPIPPRGKEEPGYGFSPMEDNSSSIPDTLSLTPLSHIDRLPQLDLGVSGLLVGGEMMLTHQMDRRIPRRLFTAGAVTAGGLLVANEVLGDRLGRFASEFSLRSHVGDLIEGVHRQVSSLPEELREVKKGFQNFLEASSSSLTDGLTRLWKDYGREPVRLKVGADLRTRKSYLALQTRGHQGKDEFWIGNKVSDGKEEVVIFHRLEPVRGYQYGFNRVNPNRVVNSSDSETPVDIGFDRNGIPQARPLLDPEIGSGAVVSNSIAGPPVTVLYLPIVLKNVTLEPTPTPTPEIPLFPELRVEGRYITFMKEQERINAEFKGGSVYSFFNGSYKFNEKTKYYIDLARQWGSNCIRLPLDIGQVSLDELKKAVDYIASQRTFCLLCPGVINGVGFQNPIYQEAEFNQLLTFTGDLVRKFKDETNVMYQLTGEPGPVEVAPGDWRYVTWAEWAPWARNLATAIRNVRSDALIGLPGVFWGRDFRDFKDHPELFPFNNFFCTVDFYRWFEDWGTPEETEITPDPNEWLCMEGTYPIFFTEIGVPDHMGGRDHWADDDAVKYILNQVEANSYMLHVSAFEMGPDEWNTSVVKDSSGTPSSRGQPYYDNYLDPNSSCPPTQFP